MRYRRLFTWLSLGLWVGTAFLGQYGNATYAEDARVRYVSPAGRDTGNCKSTKSPCRTVQFALDAAGDGETIKVASGIYAGGGSQVLLIDRDVTILGGFAPSDWEQRSWDTHPTVLDAQGKRRVVHIRRDTVVTLDGLQIVNGESGGGHGGGIYVEPSGVRSQLSLRDCALQDNVASSRTGTYTQGDGGGVYLADGALLIDTCRVTDSRASSAGGGVFARDASVTITGSTFRGNAGERGGGAVALSECEASISGSTFSDNRSGWGGGGLLATGGDLLLTESEFLDNSAASSGGGAKAIDVLAGHVHSLTHNVFQGNVASPALSGAGGGAYLTNISGSIIFSHNRVLDNVASGGTVAGEGGQGGGVYAYGPALLSHNLIQGNGAASAGQNGGKGGGVALRGPGLTLTGNYILDNYAAAHAGFVYSIAALGGGVFVNAQSDAVLRNNVIAGNQHCRDCVPEDIPLYASGAVHVGGLTSPAETRLSLHHNTIADNASPAVVNESADLRMTHSILSGHDTGVRTIIDPCGFGSRPSTALDHTLWWPRVAVQRKSGTLVRSHDLVGDPRFTRDPLAPFHLDRFSPAIDRATGDGTAVASDIDGQPRPIGPGCDLGADEFNHVDLSLSTKRVRPHKASVGDQVTYSIVLRNVGKVDATDTTVLDRIPDQVTYVPGSARATAGTVQVQEKVEWRGTVKAGGTVTISFRAVVNAPGMVRNQATVVGTYGTAHTVTVWLNGHNVYLPLIFRDCCP